MLKPLQSKKLDALLATVSSRPFYAGRGCPDCLTPPLDRAFSTLPFLTKENLVDPSGVAAVFDLPADDYVRWHQTSGTTGRPMVVRDTADDWQWWMRCWDRILDVAEVTDRDLALMAFSFGPFIGFWTANDALVRRETGVIPTGGLPSRRRVELLMQQPVTVLCATPTYALHLQSVARDMDVDLRRSQVRRIIVAGEPGGSIPEIRRRIESAFDATVIDHAGGSEIGAWGYGDPEGRGLHVIESEFIAEVVQFDGPSPKMIPRDNPDGLRGELVLTGLGRLGGPVIRYRTGDVVRPAPSPLGCEDLFLDGGVIGRVDDMVVVRGVNVFPSSIEAVVRQVCGDSEYRVHQRARGEMVELEIELDDDPGGCRALHERLQDALALSIPVRPAAEQLASFEAKSRRWIHHHTPPRPDRR